MRSTVLVLGTLLGLCGPAFSQIRIGVDIGLPSVNIGFNVPAYPTLVPVPGYPVYYAPGVDANLFFYDGMYWNLSGDRWYASSWYNGPWNAVAPEAVPLFVLRVPVSYYRRPPPYFHGWIGSAPPRWGAYWGPGWVAGHRGWDQWDRRAIPDRAPLPAYQRGYAGNRYPRAEQQQSLRTQNYRYQARDAAVRSNFAQQPGRADAGRPGERAPNNRPPQNGRAPDQRQGAERGHDRDQDRDH